MFICKKLQNNHFFVKFRQYLPPISGQNFRRTPNQPQTNGKKDIALRTLPSSPPAISSTLWISSDLSDFIVTRPQVRPLRIAVRGCHPRGDLICPWQISSRSDFIHLWISLAQRALRWVRYNNPSASLCSAPPFTQGRHINSASASLGCTVTKY